jgi:hypothetical protein
VAETELNEKERDRSYYWDNPENIRREIEEAERERDKRIGKMSQMIRLYEGPGRQEVTDEAFLPYNFYYEWMSLVRPQIAFQNPRVRVRSKKPDVNGLQAIALEHYLNRWIRDTHYIRTVERATTHMAFGHGVTMTVLDDYTPGDYDDPVSRPRKIVIDPSQFGMDSLARSWEESRIFFHKCVEDKASLLERAEKEEGWDKKAIKKLMTASNVKEIGRPDTTLDRGEVCYWEVWIPPASSKSDSMENGTLLCIGNYSSADGPKSTFLREPRPYYGPRWGPYNIWDAYYVPRSPWPMGPFQAMDGLVRALNAQARVNLRRARHRKDLLLFDESDTKDAEKILNAPDGAGVGISQFEGAKFERVNIGGVNEDELGYEQWLDNLLKRGSGLSSAELGNAASGASATADAIAARGSAARLSFLEQKVYDAVQRDLKTVAYFAWRDESIVQPLGIDFQRELVKQGVPPELAFSVPLEWKGGEKGSFDDLELEIEPYSMRRVDEAGEQAKTLQFFQLMTNIAQQIPATPWMDWNKMLNTLGERFYMPELGESVDFDIVSQFSSMMMQQQEAMVASPQKAQSPPRMSGDVKAPSGGLSRLSRPSELGTGNSMLPGKNSGAKIGAAARGQQ